MAGMKLGGSFSVVIYDQNGDIIYYKPPKKNKLFNSAYGYLLTGFTPELEIGSDTSPTDKTGSGVVAIHNPSSEITSTVMPGSASSVGSTITLVGATKFTLTTGDEFILGELAIKNFARAVLDSPRLIPANSKLEITYEFSLILKYNASGVTFNDTVYEISTSFIIPPVIENRNWAILLSQYHSFSAGVEHASLSVDPKHEVVNYATTNGIVTAWDVRRSIAPVKFDTDGSVFEDEVSYFNVADPGFAVRYALKDRAGNGPMLKSYQRIGITETFTLQLED